MKDSRLTLIELLMLLLSLDFFIFFILQPLMECYVNLKEQSGAINIQLTETWWRHYQVTVHSSALLWCCLVVPFLV